MEPKKNEIAVIPLESPPDYPKKARKRGRTKSGEIQKAPGNGVTKKDITAAKIGEALTKKNQDTIKKLEDAFAIDASVEEACLYANISPQTYYAWIKEDPELSERFKTLRLKPVLKARQEVVKGLVGDKHFSLTYLMKKRRAEFGDVPYLPPDSETRTGVVILPPKSNVVAREVVVREVIVDHGNKDKQ